MKLRNHARGYGAIAQGFHWLIAALIFATVAIAAYMTDLPPGPERIKVYNLHKSIGVAILALAVLRLVWRFVSPAPPLPGSLANWERLAARASHGALYLVLFAQPLIGLVHSGAADFPVVVFGLFTLPSLAAPDPKLKALLETVHSSLGWGFVGLILLHASAALRHHFRLKDDVLRRMLPGGGG